MNDNQVGTEHQDSKVDSKGYKALLYSVIVMGVILVFGFIFVVGVIIVRVSSNSNKEIINKTSTLEQSIILDNNQSIKNIFTNNDRIIVHVSDDKNRLGRIVIFSKSKDYKNKNMIKSVIKIIPNKQ